MKKLIITVLILLILICSSQDCQAMSKFDRFLLENPRLFRLIGLIVCACIGIIIFLYNYLFGKKEIAKAITDMTQERRKKKGIEKVVTARLKEFKKMPKGPLGEVPLPTARLISLGSEEKEYEVAPTRELTIGRSLENLVIVDRASTSREHAKIRPQPEGYVLHDMLSKSGTYVNSQKITYRVLADGDVIGIGKENFVFKIKKGMQTTPGAGPQKGKETEIKPPGF